MEARIDYGSLDELKTADHRTEIVMDAALETIFGKILQNKEEIIRREMSAGDLQIAMRQIASQLGAEETDEISKRIFANMAPSIFRMSAEDLHNNPGEPGEIDTNTVREIVSKIAKEISPKEE